MNKKKFIIICLALVFIVFTGFAFRLVNSLKKLGTIETQENVSDLSQLPSWVNVPDSAKNISYLQIFWLYNSYEFDISEEEFLDWAKEWPVHKITEPITVMRYTRYILPQPNWDDRDAVDEYESNVFHKISNGHYYYKENENRNGGGICVAYDTDKQRAYFSFAFR